MKRISSYLLGLILALAAVGCITVFMFYSKLPDFVADKLSKALKTTVRIEAVKLSLSDITIDRLEISNIPKSVLPKAFSAETISFDAPLTRYTKDHIIIDEITLDRVYLGLEFASPTNLQSNWSVLMNSASSNESPSDGKKTVFIKTLVLTNIQVDVVYKNKGKNITRLPSIDKIVLTNISSEEGLPMNQIMHTVLGQMLKSVFIQENLKDAVESLFNQPENTIDKLLSPFMGGR